MRPSLLLLQLAAHKEVRECLRASPCISKLLLLLLHYELDSFRFLSLYLHSSYESQKRRVALVVAEGRGKQKQAGETRHREKLQTCTS